MKKKQTKITRKEAIKKFGKYAAMTAVGTFIVLSPQKSAAQSPPCLLYTSPSPRDPKISRMPSSA